LLFSLQALATGFVMHRAARAADARPVGRWQTFSDKSGKLESLVRIVEVDGELRDQQCKTNARSISQ
jgi:hypothetical protein